ncbi:chitinase [Streptomyces sp. NPDC056632]|uniref:chitinase n=1 Tax=Streptomyces sp. NPDC056632 TaxID=3345884 RepID=UPI00367FDA68
MSYSRHLSLFPVLCALVLVAGIGFATGRVTAGGAAERAAPVATPTRGPTLPRSPSPSRSPAPSVTPSASASGSGPAPGRRDRARFSPYVDVSLIDRTPLAATARATGSRDFTLGFIVSDGGCAPTWGGTGGLRGSPVAAEIEQLRAAGGDVRASFGGADGVELAQACPDDESLATAYREVVETYRLTSVDFDVEGSALADGAANARRDRAIDRLQQEAADAGRVLDVTFTLPVMPEGLDATAIDLLRGAVDAGVHVTAVNIMTMNYGSQYTGPMGEYAIKAARATHKQLRGVFGLGVTEAWQAIEVTPMIGVNNVAPEVFQARDAEQVVEFARSVGLGALSMWSVARDRACPDGPQPHPEPSCSSIDQEPGAFLRAFAAYAGLARPASTATGE